MSEQSQESSNTNNSGGFLPILAGFSGGIGGAIFVAGILAVGEGVEKHVLLSAPVLAFTAFLILLPLLYGPLQQLGKRKDISEIQVGDFTLKFKELDVEMGEAITQITERLDALEKHVGLKAPDEEESAIVTGFTANTKDSAKKVETDEMKQIIFHLRNTPYRWRNAKTLSNRTGITPDRIETLVQENQETIVRSRAKSGNVIYRLKDK